MKVIIAGGGIGGLTAALSLHAAGIDVEVFEGVTEIKPLGVGINCLPHAVRELIELGLGDRLAQVGVPTRELIYANRHGQRIWQEDRGLHAGYRWPQYSIHRGRLQMLLFEAAVERLGPERVHLDHAIDRFEQDASGVTAHFVSRAVASGSSHAARESAPKREAPRGKVRADVLIGADGVHSTVRRAFYPNEGMPRWNGAILWRGVSYAKPYLSGASMIMAGNEWQKFVVYPIAAPRDDGMQEINWIAELKYKDRTLMEREDWNRQGNLPDFLPKFESWKFGYLDVPGLIRGADRVYEFPMVDRDPLARWSHDRVTLLGDAAHPMYPIGSNGSSQAILDARVLAWRLATETDPVRALELYDEERRPATGAIVMANRRNGPERVMQMAEERAPDGFANVHDVLSAAELEGSAAEYKRIAGFDVERLNARTSYSVTRG